MGKSKDLATGETRFVNTAGDTMSGDLTVTGGDVTITGSSNTDATLNVLSPSWASGAYADINIGYQPTSRKIRGHYNNGIEVFTNNTNAALKVDPTGRVTMPYQPAFFARHTTATTYNSAYVVNWNSITYNVGNHFVGSTGTFTAPVSGVYQLNSMMGNNYANGPGNYTVKLNGADYAGLIWDPYTGQTSWSTSILVGQMKLATNDTVRIYCNSTGNPDNSSWTSWSMCLLG